MHVMCALLGELVQPWTSPRSSTFFPPTSVFEHVRYPLSLTEHRAEMLVGVWVHSRNWKSNLLQSSLKLCLLVIFFFLFFFNVSLLVLLSFLISIHLGIASKRNCMICHRYSSGVLWNQKRLEVALHALFQLAVTYIMLFQRMNASLKFLFS